MKNFLTLLALLVFIAPLSAQKQSRFAYTGFSGGMMVHTGYLGGGNITLTDLDGNLYSRTLEGAPTGIGGVARIHLGNHLRIGGEGYVSTLRYGGKGNDSHARIGWGGLLADCMWKIRRWIPYVGGTIGGGGFKNLTLATSTPLDTQMETGASFRKYSYMVFVPFVGVEFAMTDKMRLNLKADWMLNLTNRQSDFASGPRIYFGISFYRMKE
jgi:hypothetical protein